MKRKSDSVSRQRARSNRLLEKDGGWYFKTREGAPMGPFADKEQAIMQLEIFIRSAESGLLPMCGDTDLPLPKVNTAG